MRCRFGLGIDLLVLASVLSTSGIAVAASTELQTSAAPTALPGVVRAVEAARRGAPIPDHLQPSLARITSFPRRDRVSTTCIATDASPKTTTRICRLGRPSSRRLIVVFGDSHAFMWVPAILEMARRDGWAVVPFIRFGCTPGWWFTREGPDVCRAWFRWSIGQIRRLHPDVTLLGGSIGEVPSHETRAAVAGVIAAARTLRSLRSLVVIGDPEGLAFNSVPCLQASGASMSSCTTTWPAASLAAYDTVARTMKSLHVGFLPTRGFVCYRRQCPAVVGHTIAWMDNNHVTGYYAAEVTPAFRRAFLLAGR